MILDNRNKIIIYQTKDGKTALEVKLQQETVWLSQAQICDLFDKNKRTISEHIRNIYKKIAVRWSCPEIPDS